jgi:predicted DNA-binding transcriptional regulator YafY
VPEYVQMRTFAVERIRKLSVLEESFNPIERLPEKPFAHSIGIHSGEPEAIEIQFAPNAAPYVRERDWHASQRIRDCADGSIVLSLSVCADWALRSWVLSFGPFARVVKPARLAESILEEIEEAREQYMPLFEPALGLYESAAQRAFPFHEPSHPAS